MNAIQIKNISKRYNDTAALDNVSLNFEAGKIYGFLGRNGAGKTTLINIIANLLSIRNLVRCQKVISQFLN